jgi:hypothetical protein
MNIQQARVEARINDLRRSGESIRFERGISAADRPPRLATRARVVVGRRLVIVGFALLERANRGRPAIAGR